ncbi:hypothetical protein CL620_03590 [archaeon]|nr:hypothetical protein [archaeon]
MQRGVPMKITIDTNQDSHDDIKKAIQLLGHIVGHHAPVTNVPVHVPAATEEQTTNMMSMFGDTSSSEPVITPATQQADSAPDFSSFLNLANKEEEPKEEAKIQFL